MSVLGPLLFSLSTTPLSSMISGHATPHNLSTNDSQLYVSFESGDSATALNGYLYQTITSKGNKYPESFTMKFALKPYLNRTHIPECDVSVNVNETIAVIYTTENSTAVSCFD